MSRQSAAEPVAGSRQLASQAQHVLENRPLIIASNRGPVEFSIEPDGRLWSRRGAGGVVTAMSAAARYSNPIWVASAMTDGDRLRAEQAETAGETFIVPPESDFRLRFVVSDPEAYVEYYNQISNPLLWFLQHYLWDTPRSPDIDAATWHAWNHGYISVNRQFAQEIAAAADALEQPPLVMLQDYHLYLTPGFLRELRPDLTIQHFIHIPWPDPDYWNLLPAPIRQTICASMLQNDIVGFQTRHFARSFMYTCEANLDGADIDYRARAVRYQGRTTWVRAYPISIDTESVRQIARGEDALRHVDHLQNFRNEFTLVRVDRAEPSKNIVRGFLAFDRFLERYPEFVGRVNFLAFLVPSRLEVSEYIDYLDDINTVVGRVNTKYANAAEYHGVPWQPITLFIGEDYPRALAALSQYDALLVNAIFDGMNLVAKEGVLLNQHAGVLILSEGAGAYMQLGPYSLTVSATDIEGTAEAMVRALTMPEAQRRAWLREMRALVERDDIVSWIYSQLQDIATLVEGELPAG